MRGKDAATQRVSVVGAAGQPPLTATVEFRLVAMRPAEGETIEGIIVGADQQGIRGATCCSLWLPENSLLQFR